MKDTDDETGLRYYGHRFYNASTGRWLSRDPLGERGFLKDFARRYRTPSRFHGHGDSPLQEYGFVANDSISDLDVLGLKGFCGRCGPDATAAVNTILAHVTAAFRDPAHAANRRSACEALFSFETAEGAWDIHFLHAMGSDPTAVPVGMDKKVHGTGGCERTEVYNGECVYASALNYMLFGKMNSLCQEEFGGYSEALMVAAVYFHKRHILRQGKNHHEANQAFCFARIGYGVSCGCGGRNGKALEGCDTCHRASVPYSDKLTWHWTHLLSGPPQGG